MKHVLTVLLATLLFCYIAAQQSHAAVVFGIIPAESTTVQGVPVAQVVNGTPAQQAGIQVGDIITHINSCPIPNAAILRETLSKLKVGNVIRVFYLRGEDKHIALVELQERPAEFPQQGSEKAAPQLTPEQLLQFAQVRTRLRLQLARLPHRMNTAQVKADLAELLTLARSIPAAHNGWLQGKCIETTMEYAVPQGRVVLKQEKSILYLELHTTAGACRQRYCIDDAARQQALPAEIIRLLQHL